MLSLGLIGGCLNLPSAEPYGVPAELEKKINDQNEQAVALIQEGRYEEGIVYLEEAVAYVYEADPELRDLTQEKRVPFPLDTPFNNLSWAYHELGDYQQALAYAEKSILLLPNDDVEYTNKANALYHLGRTSEALTSYEKAVDLNSKNARAHYWIGLISYEMGDYEAALKKLNKYLDAHPDNGDAASMRVYTLLQLDRPDVAEEYADNFLKRYSNTYEGYWAMAAYLEETAGYDEILAFHIQAAERFPSEWVAQVKVGQTYYDHGDYESALKQFKSMTLVFPQDPELEGRLIRTYSALGDREGAETVYMNSNAPQQLLAAMGQLYLDHGYYTKAIEFYDAVNVNQPWNETGYVKKLQALSWGKRYVRCVELGEQLLKTTEPSSAEIPWFTGRCEMELGQTEKAAEHFKLATEIDAEDGESWSQLALAHFTLGHEPEAREYSERALEMNAEDPTASYVREALDGRNQSLGSRIKAFMKENYLYGKDLAQLDRSLKRLDSPDLSLSQMATIIDQSRQYDDQLTFLAYGELYEQLTKSDKGGGVFHKDIGQISYFKLDEFSRTTDDQFIKLADDIPSPEEKTLILDLRGNGGGLTESANNILDILLPELTTSTLIYQDGTTYSYYSGPDQIHFSNIAIFVDEDTASAAELLTLGLKTYGDHVSIIGRTTSGKGVGQLVMEDKEHQVLLYVVNHRWNVLQSNIASSRIVPDVKVTGNELEDFIARVKIPRK